MDSLRAETRDTDMLESGRWKAVSSVMRYRKPALYMRRLEQLSPAQLALARVAPKQIALLVPKMLL